MSRWLLLLALSGCTASLPEILPEQFACEDDKPLDDGSLPCPETHRCDDGRCRLRLDCNEASGREGCDPTARRCELYVSSELAGVSCESGTHTTTSAQPVGPECACPDGAQCTVRMQTGALYLLPASTSSVGDRIAGLGAEDRLGRICARPCSSEADCPAHHTCRAADVVGPSDPKRRTIGVCYPDFLVKTATRSATGQPDPLACPSPLDCKANLGRPTGRCTIDLEAVPDPAGGTHLAMIPRCVDDPGGPLKDSGKGCLDAAECKSGVCLNNSIPGVMSGCARLCDPNEKKPCGDPAILCKDVEVERRAGDDRKIIDHVFVCGR